MAEGGLASVIAHSGFVSRVEETLCDGCGACAEACSFTAVTVEGAARVEDVRCAGCGVCTVQCPNHALSLVRRSAEETAPVPVDDGEWLRARAAWRRENAA
jgi:MinD superfamily P-loop ATPase